MQCSNFGRTENYKQWNIEEIHKVLKCYMFEEDLEEYIKLKEEYQEEKRGRINER